MKIERKMNGSVPGEIVATFEAGEVVPRPVEGLVLFLFTFAKGVRLYQRGDRDLLALAIGRALLATAERGEITEGGAEPVDFSPLERRLQELRAGAEEARGGRIDYFGHREAKIAAHSHADGFEEALRLLVGGEVLPAGVGVFEPFDLLRAVEAALLRLDWLGASDRLGALGLWNMRRLVRAAECLAAGSPQDAIRELDLLDCGRCPDCGLKIRRKWDGEGAAPGHQRGCPRQGQPAHTWEVTE